MLAVLEVVKVLLAKVVLNVYAHIKPKQMYAC